MGTLDSRLFVLELVFIFVFSWSGGVIGQFSRVSIIEINPPNRIQASPAPAHKNGFSSLIESKYRHHDSLFTVEALRP